MSPSNIVGTRKADTIDCQLWLLILWAGEWPCFSPVLFLRHLRLRWRPPPFQSYSRSAATPSRPGSFELLRDFAPKLTSIGLLVNPNNPNAAVQTKEMQAATTALGLHLQVLSAGSQSDFDNTFAALVQQRPDALVV